MRCILNLVLLGCIVALLSGCDFNVNVNGDLRINFDNVLELVLGGLGLG